MGELRGAKRDLWEGGHRVPFLARWPGRIKPGAVSDEPICHVDLLATVAAILGAPLADNAAEDSLNVLPALLGEKRERPLREAMVHHAGSGKFALRQGDWVLIDAPTGDDNGGPQRNGEPAWLKQARHYIADPMPGELFNVHDDLSERRNLYAEQPVVVQRLKALLEQYKSQGRRRPGSVQQKE